MEFTNSGVKARAAGVFPGGVLGRHRYPDDIAHVPMSGQGARVTDLDGRTYIDYSCGGGSLILGYSHPAVVQAIQRQAAIATQFVSILNVPAIKLAERIKQLVPWVDEVRFALSGSEAVMFALRLARAATGREKILKFEGAYHGNSDYALWGVNPKKTGLYPNAQAESAGIPRAIQGQVLVAPYNDFAVARRIIEENWKELAGVIVEPVQRYYAAEPEFLSGLREICTRYGVALIFDEIVTGFRHALGGAAEYIGITPDLSVFGKALGGGLPVSSVAGKRKLMEHSNPRRGGVDVGYCYVTSSQAGNPLGCAASLATLDELARPGVITKFHEHAEILKAELRDMVKHHRSDAQVVGVGPLWDVIFTTEKVRDHRSAETADKRLHLQFHMGLIRHGIMVRPGGRSYFSTSHGSEEIGATVLAAETALKEMMA